jgi:type IV secretory pathway VirJ component
MARSGTRVAAVLAIGAALAGRASTSSAQRNSTPPLRAWDERKLTLPIVGPSSVYVPHAATNHVVLFVSGDGGWERGVRDMAARMAPQAIVIGISFPALRRAALRQKRGCWYPAADLERIAHAAQKVLRRPEYEPPILIGYSSGATLVYAALAAAPAVTFAGGVSLGFCPDLEVARLVCPTATWKPSYDEKKHVNWLPATASLSHDWYALHGPQDEVCDLEEVRTFVRGIRGAHLVEIEGTGHGFSKPQRWGKPFDEALSALFKAQDQLALDMHPKPPAIGDLEQRFDRLELPLQYRWPANPSSFLVFFSGDGGWASIDEGIAAELSVRGVGVVGLSSLRYFWEEKSPAQVAADLRRIVSVAATTNKPVFAGGYSFGAEALSVAMQEWARADRAAVRGLALVAPAASASFEIDPLDWIRTPEDNPATRVAPAVRALGLPTLCITGTEDEEGACQDLENVPGIQVARLPGSHHFRGDYTAVADLIAQFILKAQFIKPPVNE